MIRALAQVVASRPGATVPKNFLITDGEYAGCIFAACREVTTPHGAIVAVKFSPDDQFAYEVREPEPTVKREYDKQGDVLVFKFYVPGFTQEQIDALVGEVLVQGEASELHPEARVIQQDVEALDVDQERRDFADAQDDDETGAFDRDDPDDDRSPDSNDPSDRDMP